MYISLNSPEQDLPDVRSSVVRQGLVRRFASKKDLKVAKDHVRRQARPPRDHGESAFGRGWVFPQRRPTTTIDQLDMAPHSNVSGRNIRRRVYASEPNAGSTMRKMVSLGARFEGGRGSRTNVPWATPQCHVLVRRACALTIDFSRSCPMWPSASTPRLGQRRWSSSTSNPSKSRKHLVKNHLHAPEYVVDTVPMIRLLHVGDLTAKTRRFPEVHRTSSVAERGHCRRRCT